MTLLDVYLEIGKSSVKAKSHITGLAAVSGVEEKRTFIKALLS